MAHNGQIIGWRDDLVKETISNFIMSDSTILAIYNDIGTNSEIAEKYDVHYNIVRLIKIRKTARYKALIPLSLQS
jgi:hypothetical protein